MPTGGPNIQIEDAQQALLSRAQALATPVNSATHNFFQEVPNTWTTLAWDLNPHTPSVYYSIGMAMHTRLRRSVVPPKGIGGRARMQAFCPSRDRLQVVVV